MAVIPIPQTSSFCDFVLQSPIKRLSAARKTLIQDVNNAAIAQTAMTDDDWNSFLMSTEDYLEVWNINLAWNPQALYTQALLDYFTQVTTHISTPRAQLLNNLILQLQLDGNWSKLDRLWLFTSEAQDQAIVSLVNPTATKIVNVNSTTWAANVGFTGNAANMYLNTKYNMSTSISQLSLNSSCFGVYQRGNLTGASMCDIGCANGTPTYSEIQPRGSGNKTYTDNYNAAAGEISPNNNDARGMFSAVRTASNAQAIWRNGTVLGSNAGASVGLIAQECFLLARNNNGATDSYSNHILGAAWFGAGTIDQLKFYNAIQTFMTAIGANV